MTTVIKHDGDLTTLRYAVGECSLGLVLVARSDQGVCAMLLGEAAGELVRELQQRFPDSTLVAGGADFDVVLDKVVGFIEAPAGIMGKTLSSFATSASMTTGPSFHARAFSSTALTSPVLLMRNALQP